MKLHTISGILLAVGLTSCAEPQPRPIRPPINPAGEQGKVNCEETPNAAGCKSERPPVTNPPVTNPPMTNPPVTNPPMTNPPVTNPPVTNPPVANPPVTNPPVANPPVTNPPASTAQCAADSVCKTFTAKEIALCKLYSADPGPCNAKQWSKDFYASITKQIESGRTACTVQGTEVNFRSSCSLDNAAIIQKIQEQTIIERIRSGTAACPSGTDGGKYTEVKYSGKTGFVWSAGIQCL
jgi:hypothetical protein